MSLKKAQEIASKCLDEMYKASTPPTSWAKIKKDYSNTKIRFFERHTITQEKYDKIKAKYEKQMPHRYRCGLAWLLLDYSPKFKEAK